MKSTDITTNTIIIEEDGLSSAYVNCQAGTEAIVVLVAQAVLLTNWVCPHPTLAYSLTILLISGRRKLQILA